MQKKMLNWDPFGRRRRGDKNEGVSTSGKDLGGQGTFVARCRKAPEKALNAAFMYV